MAGAGTLPSNWGNLSSLQYLGIAANAFTGSLNVGVESADATGAFKQLILPAFQLRHVYTSQAAHYLTPVCHLRQSQSWLACMLAISFSSWAAHKTV